MRTSDVLCQLQWSFHAKKLLIFKRLRPRQNSCHFPNESFKYNFFNANIWDEISLRYVPYGDIRQYGSSIGWHNCLVLSRRQIIISTNVGIFYWRIYASLGLNEFMIMLDSLIWSDMKVLTWEIFSSNGNPSPPGKLGCEGGICRGEDGLECQDTAIVVTAEWHRHRSITERQEMHWEIPPWSHHGLLKNSA